MKNLLIRLFAAVSVAGLLFVVFSFLTSPDLPTEGKEEGRSSHSPVEEVRNLYLIPSIPEQLSFAGEPVPLDLFDIYERMDRELVSNSYFHSQTFRLLKLAPRYFSIIEPILKANGVPSDFKYLAVAESGLNPKAVSSAGAVGLWQFLRDTGKQYGLEVRPEVDERYHVEKATVAACKYLKESYQKYGNWTMAAASYNAGKAGVSRFITNQKETDYYNLLLSEETERYIFRILALKVIMEDPESYGFSVADNQKYPLFRTIEFKTDTTISNLTDFAQSHNTNYKTLKILNPWLRDLSLTVSSGKSYTILLPAKGFK